jgi:hypothetical protein
MGTVKKANRTVLQKLARRTLQRVLDDNNISRKELSRRFHELGWDEPDRSISNKIMRGTFSFQFVLLCMLALRQKEISLPMPPLTPELLGELKRDGAQQRRKPYPGKQWRRPKREPGEPTGSDE